MAEKKLTEQQRKWARAYAETGNGAEAARIAGYSKKYANRSAAYNLKHEGIMALVREYTEKAEDESIAKVKEVMQTLTRILRREETETVVVMQKTHRSFYDEDGKKQIVDTETPVSVEIPAKLSDVNKAAELIGKRWGMYRDNVDVNGAIPVVISGAEQLED